MVQVILLIIGVAALYKKSFRITNRTELKQPKLRQFGIIIIIVVLLTIAIEIIFPNNSTLDITVYTLMLIIPIIVAIKIKEPIQSLKK